MKKIYMHLEILSIKIVNTIHKKKTNSATNASNMAKILQFRVTSAPLYNLTKDAFVQA